MTAARRSRVRSSSAARTGPDAPATPARVTVRTGLGRRRLEGLQLEIRRLALRLGLAVADVRVRRIDPDGAVRVGGRPRRATPSARRARPRRG